MNRLPPRLHMYRRPIVLCFAADVRFHALENNSKDLTVTVLKQTPTCCASICCFPVGSKCKSQGCLHTSVSCWRSFSPFDGYCHLLLKISVYLFICIRIKHRNAVKAVHVDHRSVATVFLKEWSEAMAGLLPCSPNCREMCSAGGLQVNGCHCLTSCFDTAIDKKNCRLQTEQRKSRRVSVDMVITYTGFNLLTWLAGWRATHPMQNYGGSKWIIISHPGRKSVALL